MPRSTRRVLQPTPAGLVRPSRRGLLRAGAGGLALGLAGGLGLPRRGRASVSAADRRFLVVQAIGGWDTAYGLWPFHDNPDVDIEEGYEPAEVGGHPFVESEHTPSVRTFFETWGDRVCGLHGFEIPSITHTRCRRLLLTGGTSQESDDFGTILAWHGARSSLLPHAVLGGFAYGHRYGSVIERVGSSGQFDLLLDSADCFRQSTVPVNPTPASVQAAVDELVGLRAERSLAQAASGQPAARAESHLAAHDRVSEVLHLEDLDLQGGKSFDGQLALGLDLLESGLSRVVTVRHNGADNGGWDEHIDIVNTGPHFEHLFGRLDGLMAELATRPGLVGDTLLDEVTVLVASEMGRHPNFNAHGGKHHWTFTSCLLMGAGVRGGQAIGGYDASALGERMDFASGEVHESGLVPTCNHLNATLLALGDVDPGDYRDGADIIEAILA